MPYTYLIGWSEYDRWYYGVRYAQGSTPSDLWTSYFTSSQHVKDFREKFGEPDVVKVRREFVDKKAAQDWEMKVLGRLRVLNDDRWLNKNIGGTNFGNNWLGRKHTPETIHKMRTVDNSSHLTSEQASLQMLERVQNGTHPGINAAKNGTHHWQTEEHRDRVATRNTAQFSGSVTVTDKYGNNTRISKVEFVTQQIGPRETWNFVGVASKEGKERRQHAHTN